MTAPTDLLRRADVLEVLNDSFRFSDATLAIRALPADPRAAALEDVAAAARALAGSIASRKRTPEFAALDAALERLRRAR